MREAFVGISILCLYLKSRFVLAWSRWRMRTQWYIFCKVYLRYNRLSLMSRVVYVIFRVNLESFPSLTKLQVLDRHTDDSEDY